MTTDQIIVAHDLHRAIADLGGGLFFGCIATIGFVWLGIVRGPFSGLIAFFIFSILGVFLTSWAHTFSPTEGRDVIRTCAAVAGAAIAGIVTISIVHRAPATAMIGLFSILAGGGSVVALWLYAPHQNLVLLVEIIGIVAFLGFAAIVAMLMDRRHAREIQNTRLINMRNAEPARIERMDSTALTVRRAPGAPQLQKRGERLPWRT